MPIPASPLRRGERGPTVAELHRTFEAMNRPIDQGGRHRRMYNPATETLMCAYQAQSALAATGIFNAETLPC